MDIQNGRVRFDEWRTRLRSIRLMCLKASKDLSLVRVESTRIEVLASNKQLISITFTQYLLCLYQLEEYSVSHMPFYIEAEYEYVEYSGVRDAVASSDDGRTVAYANCIQQKLL